jgi:Mo-dependent nitrogenase C-terminus
MNSYLFPVANLLSSMASYFSFKSHFQSRVDFFQPLRHWIDAFSIDNIELAHKICQFIPAQCPFEKDINLFGYTFHIPPMCKLNPLYEEVVALRFRAMCYLADECGEDISQYC